MLGKTKLTLHRSILQTLREIFRKKYPFGWTTSLAVDQSTAVYDLALQMLFKNKNGPQY